MEEQGVLPAVPPAPTPEPASEVPASAPMPMTRRERRLLEETGVIPIPTLTEKAAAKTSEEETTLLEVSVDETATPEPPAAPLPPVFGPPVTTAPSPQVPMAPSPPASRMVGEVTMATSSLILPVSPTVDMTGPIGDTGEVIVTGQITLPTRVTETGSIPLMGEDRDDDEQFDAYVTGELAAMSQPVRAVKAVSGQGDDTDILLVRRVRWGTAAILTASGAAVLGVGAVVLLVIALMTDALV